MSHFTPEHFGLEASHQNVLRIKQILKAVGDQYEGVGYIQNKVITNRYGMEKFVLGGLAGPAINPLGFQIIGGEILLQVDLDTDHRNSETRENTVSLYEQLQAQIINIRNNDAIGSANQAAEQLRQTGANVCVTVHG